MYGDQQSEGNSDIVRSLVTYLALGLGHQAQLAAWLGGLATEMHTEHEKQLIAFWETAFL